MNCKDCKCFCPWNTDDNEGYGTCHRHAPSFFVSPHHESTIKIGGGCYARGVFPVVHESYFCLEGIPKQSDKKPPEPQSPPPPTGWD
nr:MAG TPA: hypothetical protein [Caudoviricetes sp.]